MQPQETAIFNKINSKALSRLKLSFCTFIDLAKETRQQKGRQVRAVSLLFSEEVWTTAFVPFEAKER